LAFDSQIGASGAGAFADDAQTMVAWLDSARVKSPAIIAHAQFYPVCRLSVNVWLRGGTIQAEQTSKKRPPEHVQVLVWQSGREIHRIIRHIGLILSLLWLANQDHQGHVIVLKRLAHKVPYL
jgi:hypothetical protein